VCRECWADETLAQPTNVVLNAKNLWKTHQAAAQKQQYQARSTNGIGARFYLPGFGELAMTRLFIC